MIERNLKYGLFYNAIKNCKRKNDGITNAAERKAFIFSILWWKGEIFRRPLYDKYILLLVLTFLLFCNTKNENNRKTKEMEAILLTAKYCYNYYPAQRRLPANVINLREFRFFVIARNEAIQLFLGFLVCFVVPPRNDESKFCA